MPRLFDDGIVKQARAVVAPLLVLGLLAVAAFCFWLLVGDPLFGHVAERADYAYARRMGLSTWLLVMVVAACLSVALWGAAVLTMVGFWVGTAVLGVAPWLATDMRHKLLKWQGRLRRDGGAGSEQGARRPLDVEALLRQAAAQSRQADAATWMGQLGGLGVALSDGSTWGVGADGQFAVTPPGEAEGV